MTLGPTCPAIKRFASVRITKTIHTDLNLAAERGYIARLEIEVQDTTDGPFRKTVDIDEAERAVEQVERAERHITREPLLHTGQDRYYR